MLGLLGLLFARTPFFYFLIIVRSQRSQYMYHLANFPISHAKPFDESWLEFYLSELVAPAIYTSLPCLDMSKIDFILVHLGTQSHGTATNRFQDLMQSSKPSWNCLERRCKRILMLVGGYLSFDNKLEASKMKDMLF